MLYVRILTPVNHCASTTLFRASASKGLNSQIFSSIRPKEFLTEPTPPGENPQCNGAKSALPIHPPRLVVAIEYANY